MSSRSVTVSPSSLISPCDIWSPSSSCFDVAPASPLWPSSASNSTDHCFPSTPTPYSSSLDCSTQGSNQDEEEHWYNPCDDPREDGERDYNPPEDTPESPRPPSPPPSSSASPSPIELYVSDHSSASSPPLLQSQSESIEAPPIPPRPIPGQLPYSLLYPSTPHPPFSGVASAASSRGTTRPFSNLRIHIPPSSLPPACTRDSPLLSGSSDRGDEDPPPAYSPPHIPDAMDWE